MNYRKIEINGSYTDEELDSILFQIGKWHNITPKIWIPDYRVTDSDIEETIQRIRNTKNEELFLMIAEDGQGQMQGFIWAIKQEEPKESVMILSLYVTEGYRKQGVATRLKVLLEDWCRHENIKIIHTTTHYSNHNMIKLNKDLGYIPGMVHMTKTL